MAGDVADVGSPVDVPVSTMIRFGRQLNSTGIPLVGLVDGTVTDVATEWTNPLSPCGSRMLAKHLAFSASTGFKPTTSYLLP